MMDEMQYTAVKTTVKLHVTQLVIANVHVNLLDSIVIKPNTPMWK